jgi:Flp pilus assembly protein TadB
MRDWDKKESEWDKKLNKYSEKVAEKQSRNLPSWWKHIEFRIAYFKLKYGIKVSVKKFYALLIGTNLFAWVGLPFLVDPVEPWRSLVILSSFMFFFIIDKGDGSRRRKDPPPSDDPGDTFRIGPISPQTDYR